MEKIEIFSAEGAAMGGYNDPLPNMREITEKEFAQSHFFSYDAVGYGHKQILPTPLRKAGVEPATNGHHDCMTSVKYFVYHDGTGVAMTSDYWAGKVRYFHFAVCDHEMVELSGAECDAKGIQHYGRCWHVRECKKCGYVQSSDSSD